MDADDATARERDEYAASVEEMIDAEQGYMEWRHEMAERGLLLEYPNLEDVECSPS